ncbi:MAG: vitamin K epoxide reductase family protein [Bacteroidales bacterium]
MDTALHPWPRWRWVLAGLNTLALVLTLIMSWHYLAGGSIAGCGGGSPCEKVLGSRWSEIGGMLPVSGLAMGVYLAMLVAGFFTGPAAELPVRRIAWGTMLIMAGAVAGSAVWFTAVQKWIIGAFCPYCLAAHITGTLLSVLIIWRSVRASDHGGLKDYHPASGKLLFRPVQVTGLVMAGMFAAGLLAVIQVISAPPAVYSDIVSQENAPAVDYHAVPMTGSPDAPHVVTLLFDYQCTHCQQLHFMLDETVLLHEGKLAFMLCPAPLDPGCNSFIPPGRDEYRNSCELAKISLAVWRGRREAFPEFENWMFTFETGDRWHPRSPEAARVKAVELLGKDLFDAALSDPWIEEYLQTSIGIFGRTIQNGMGGIPKLIYGSRWVTPESFSAGDLAMILQKSLLVPEP